MAALDDIARPDNELSGPTGTSNAQKFADIWWRLCSRTGLSKLIAAFVDAVLGKQVAQFDASWAPSKTVTWLGREVAALPQNFKNTQEKADAAKAAVDQLRADLPGLIANAVANQPAAVASIDANAVAEAVFQRLKAQANK